MQTRRHHFIPCEQTSATGTALLREARHEHDVPLQALGSVNGYQVDSSRGGGRFGVEVAETLAELRHVDGPGILLERVEQIEVSSCVRLLLGCEVGVSSEGAPC